MTFRAIISFILVLTFSLFVVPAASAHNTQPRLEISVERLNPGEVVDVRGVSFDMDENITLALLGTGMEISMGEILSDAYGDFIYIAVLPEDLPEGTYYFRATSSHHWVISPPLTVWGTAFSEGGGQGPRAEEDGLLAPMPTIKVTVPVPVATPTLVPHAQIEQASSVLDWNTNILVMALLMSILVVVVVGFWKKSKR